MEEMLIPEPDDVREKFGRLEAGSFPFLDDEQRQRFAELVMSPVLRRIPEQDEEIFTLRLIGLGFAAEAVQEFINALHIPENERSPRQRLVVTVFGVHYIQKPDLNWILMDEETRATFEKWMNLQFQSRVALKGKGSVENPAEVDELKDKAKKAYQVLMRGKGGATS